MEEGECLPLLKDGDLHTLNTDSRTIGSLVHVFCHNVTVAILKCLAEQKWNGTISPCHTAETKNEIKPGEEMKVETIIIIVWVLGGVLLFSLLILLTVILTARHKGGARRPRRRPSIFTVSNERRRGGGDNPAFSTENEQANWSLHRNSQRLPPTYREAMMDRPPRLEPSRTQASASSGPPQSGASQDDNSRRYAQEYPSCFWDEEPPPPYSLFAGGRGSSDRIISVERTNSNRMAVVQSPRPPRNPSRSAQEPTSSTPSSNHRTIVQCNAQTNQQIIPSTLSNESRRSTNSSNPQHRSTARAQIHHPANSSSETRRNPRRPDPTHQRERPVPSPQLTRSSTSNEAQREPNTLYRCGRLEGTAPLARLEIEYF
ncbi:hypothetical protein LOTGIDRAFT_234875 [Lottia gigantea]|uniref:Sushi domain-containing protein n=1 Tax=Lottia gigantea TaxID=225164 RepID=V3ZZ38_LOTGI|nr:hypothetical protein LOTGIDRAFT_234875 [Lottia gigantea]ESO87885.1 hypothetical protein LOTGIDRAFT_234875 [Lottia gigantea]